MKRRLFWKILFAFWLTLFAITQGVWLLFELNRNERPAPGWLMERDAATVVLAAGSDAIEHGGPAALDSLLAKLPERQRHRLHATPSTPAPQSAQGSDPAFTREVVAPDGQRYRLTYAMRPDRLPRPRLMNVPPEFLVLGALGGLLFSFVLAWYLTEPINRLRTGLDQLAQGQLDVRLGPSMGRRRDEIADLGRDFDLMAQRLEHLVATRDRLLHDVSHELRSPLARLQLAIGIARKKPDDTEQTHARVEREVIRLEMLVNELLTLARAEHGDGARDGYFDLGDIVASVTEDACFEAEAIGVRILLTTDMPDDEERPLVTGNAELVHRALDNIVRNAVRFSPAGDAVEVAASYSPVRKTYCVEVADRGPGMPESDMASMFDPFVRGEESGDGLGLGLSIASRAIAAHGGSVSARNRDGGGLVVSVSLPASA